MAPRKGKSNSAAFRRNKKIGKIRGAQSDSAAVIETKTKKMKAGVKKWTAFYRANPQRFAADYLNVNLKLFQKILIWCMMWHDYFLFIASRGLGKTYLVALYCIIRCILYPGTKICIASATRGQANEVIGKIIDDFMKEHTWGSANLRREIIYANINNNKAEVHFRNHSWIKVVTASDNARGARANILVIRQLPGYMVTYSCNRANSVKAKYC